MLPLISALIMLSSVFRLLSFPPIDKNLTIILGILLHQADFQSISPLPYYLPDDTDYMLII